MLIFDSVKAGYRLVITELESGVAMARGKTEFRGDPGVCPECHLDMDEIGIHAFERNNKEFNS